MEQNPIDLEEAVKDFAEHMRRYGYRNSFSIKLDQRKEFSGNLNDCLNRYVAANIQVVAYPLCELRTKAPYNPDIQCRFTIEFDKHSGFQIHKMLIHHLKSKIEHEYRLRNNKELPGAQTLGGLFPKPKPWDFFKRGRFRP